MCAAPTDFQSAVCRRSPQEFEDVFHINVAGVFATIQAFYPLLKVCCHMHSVWRSLEALLLHRISTLAMLWHQLSARRCCLWPPLHAVRTSRRRQSVQ